VGEVLWEWSLNVVRDEYGNEYPINSPTPVDNGKGEYRHNRNMYTINPVLHSGDGTVPRASWEKDLACPDLRGYCCIGANPTNENGFGHQDAFHYGPAREASLYLIAKLVSDNAGELKT
jgi:hypothetical protein